MNEAHNISLFEKSKIRPLADMLRPKKFEEMVGQEHIFDKHCPIKRMIDQKRAFSSILWGPPGSGKTTIARLLTTILETNFVEISAVFSSVSDLRKIFEDARQNNKGGISTTLFVDEVHRFNRSQQDSFLPYVEDGTIILIGATTENPSFEINSALLSRLQVIILNRLNEKNLLDIITRAEKFKNRKLNIDEDGKKMLCKMADGDARCLLNYLEELFMFSKEVTINSQNLVKILQQKLHTYDKDRDGHYSLISALHKSLRGSDCDASLYWLARMIVAGEDLNYIARRLLRFAYEDIGLADPEASTHCLTAWETYERLGSPEGELAIAQSVIYLATAPKSNSGYKAYNESIDAAKKSNSLPPPKHIINAPSTLMKKIGYGKEYIYDHDTKEGFSGQNYFPDDVERYNFYYPIERGFEREIKKRLNYWMGLRKKLSKTEK